MSSREQWGRLVASIKQDIPGFDVRYKEEDAFQKLIGKVSFWNDYMAFTTTLYPVVWLSTRAPPEAPPPRATREHAWVHLKDATTFFGLLPFLPASINSRLFNLAYLFPQVLAVFGLLGFVFPPALICLLALAPIPAPVRMWAEMRAYRRSVELNSSSPERRERALNEYVTAFTSSEYWFMWPARTWVRTKLQEPSPYKDVMDAAVL